MTRLVDLTHPWGLHTPPWLGYPSPKIYYTQRFHNQGVVSQFIETSLHTGTHMDAQMHMVPNGTDMASVPLDTLFGDGVIVDISDRVGMFDVIKPEHFEGKVEIKKGDILIYHTGWHHYYTHEREMDEEKYFCTHPAGAVELANWIIDMQFKWIGVDCGAAEHPMNTTLRDARPDIRKKYEKVTGKNAYEEFPEETLAVMHKKVFRHNILHCENIGGDIDDALNVRCKIGAFPWRFVGGEASICRVVAFIEE